MAYVSLELIFIKCFANILQCNIKQSNRLHLIIYEIYSLESTVLFYVYSEGYFKTIIVMTTTMTRTTEVSYSICLLINLTRYLFIDSYNLPVVSIETSSKSHRLVIFLHVYSKRFRNKLI